MDFNSARHCERSEAIHLLSYPIVRLLHCRVAALLAMTLFIIFRVYLTPSVVYTLRTNQNLKELRP